MNDPTPSGPGLPRSSPQEVMFRYRTDAAFRRLVDDMKLHCREGRFVPHDMLCAAALCYSLYPDNQKPSEPNVAKTNAIRAFGDAVERSLTRVADSVARHVIQGDGLPPDDVCFNIDLRDSQKEIINAAIELLKECAR